MFNSITNNPVLKQGYQIAEQGVLAGLGAGIILTRESKNIFSFFVKAGQEAETKGIKKAEEMKKSSEKFVNSQLKFIEDNIKNIGQEAVNALESTTQMVMRRYNIPSADEVQSLSLRIEQLQKELNK